MTNRIIINYRRNNICAINKLAILYDKYKKYHSAEKYYKMAINNNDTYAIYNLELLYKDNIFYQIIIIMIW